MGSEIGERAFQGPADFDAQLPIVLGHDQQRAIIDPGAAELPGVRDPVRIVGDVLGAVVATTNTAICEPLRASKAASLSSRVACCSAVSVPVRSMTRYGTGC